MKIALLQLNLTVGDLDGNLKLIIDAVNKAAERGVRLCITSELAITGYPPRDLLLNADFVARCRDAVEELSHRIPDGVALLAGGVDLNHGNIGNPLRNAAWLIERGEAPKVFYKWLLPTYDVFDEQRYFEPARQVNIFEVSGVKVGVTICEDVWNDRDGNSHKRYGSNPIPDIMAEHPDVLVNLSASPFNIGKQVTREKMLSDISSKYEVPVLYANQVGGNDDLVFDGRSCAFNAQGQLVARGGGFKEDIVVVDSDCRNGTIEEDDFCEESEAWNAMVLGLRDYLAKTGFKQVVLGLSGGIDSALTAAVAAEALGPENVTGVLMPSPYSSKGSVDDSLDLVANIGINSTTIPIHNLMDQFEEALAPTFKGLPANVTEENIQSRIRGNLVMAISNKMGALLVTTGNKSELAVGYCTIYGDMAGGLAVISDLYKTLVFRVCCWLNERGRGEIIPVPIIEKPPSAELRPDQKDEDSLPPYDILDHIIELRVERHMAESEIIAETGYDPEVVRQVLRLIKISEFKRKQAAPGLKITSRAFGTGWRMPIACRFTG
ncbi:NAD+ synthase [Maridesulfovibrio hydrothermalis]|uniref:Glutamine-dependent NAD(+) synthetase n=1 Tax=Maridesulfovibrio hydrothermalis AM13 = DSM 14728 TaxID=1121451 RepID=L0R7D8_9BACT|nr:NAD+ synthase [Maridesulfovibrio hydrothermalis]CCO22132.1 putative glutamine-dependent NAD(+) synthetase [Maridesulfovibrio hydrothermalis AM13 = DSM 14728]